MRFTMYALLASFCAIDAIAEEHTTIIHAGTLLAVPGNAPENNRSIIIEGGQITRVEDGFVDPANVSGEVTVIDLSDKFVLPGLMDMHVHLLFELGPNARMEALQVTTSMPSTSNSPTEILLRVKTWATSGPSITSPRTSMPSKFTRP